VDEVSLTIDGRVARLLLDRPGRRNAITPEMLSGIITACATIASAAVDVAVLGSSGADFSVGFDLERFEDRSAADGARLGGEATEAIRGLEAVTVAELSGWVVGGGVALAGACDLRVATPDTRFRIPEVPLGIPLGWGAIPLLVSLLGPAVTKDIVMTGRDVDLDEAVARGLVSRVGRADALVERLLEVPRGPLLATKAQVDEVARVASTASEDAERLLEAVSDPAFAEAFGRYRAGLRP
jgi:enoyl-CoA hydratase/carnithine racemase